MRRFFAPLLVLTYLALATAAQAGFLINSYSVQAAGGGGATPTITFLQCTNNTSDLTTYSFAGVNIGTANATRSLVISVSGRDSATVFTVSTVTVDGSGATERLELNVGDTVGDLYTIAWPTGTTATIAVTFSEAVITAGICVGTLNDAASLVPNDTASVNNGTTGTTITLDTDVSAFGVAVGFCFSGNDTWNWTGLTERDDHEVAPAGTGSLFSTWADFTNDSSADVPLAITSDPLASGDSNGCVVAAFL